MNPIAALGRFHGRFLHPGRVERLSELIRPLIPTGADRLLDVGCGDGRLASLLEASSPGLHVEGVDVLLRQKTVIPVTSYDGKTLPHANKSVDVTILVDVLHHADDPMLLLKECARVTRMVVIVKDHIAENLLDTLTLKAMDWIGNRHSGVALPYNYPSASQWFSMIEEASLVTRSWSMRVPVYRPPMSFIAGRGLHLLATLSPPAVVAP